MHQELPYQLTVETENWIEKKDGSVNYYFFNDDGTYDTFDSVLCNWYRPLIQNIMAYHYKFI